MRLRAPESSLCSLLLVSFVLGAPMQCPAQREPQRVRVTPPAEAVYEAAEHLREQGYERAYVEMLEHLVARYPGTSASARAETELERAGRPGAGGAEEGPVLTETVTSN